MSGTSSSSIFRVIQGLVGIFGGTDGTQIGNVGDRIKTDTGISSIDLTISALLNLTTGSGFLIGEEYDLIEYGLIGGPDGRSLLTFSLLGISQFQVLIDLVSNESFTIQKRASLYNLLQEDGFGVLQENGDNLLIEGLIP